VALAELQEDETQEHLLAAGVARLPHLWFASDENRTPWARI